ncbi:hypothetical protein EMPS_02197 [Entomortierella parvispora]|uniref:Uncharacterized protein n=1 Tax=Entomortierella parvispora TaxID=205924 RepID=A0A9P3LTB4_9FUNG|nr:hypothetical protein EMPS_02197 [Entomortierella parvispora]
MASTLCSRIASTSHIRSLLTKTSHSQASVSARSFSASSAYCSRRKNASSTSTATSTAPLANKQTKNPFLAPANSVLAYVGPYAGSLRQCKSVAFVFGACGCIAIPSTLFLGNTEHALAVMAGVASLSPSVLLHALFKDNVTKIHVQGTADKNTAAAAVKVSSSDDLKLTFEKLNWRGVPLHTQVSSSDLRIKSETEKVVHWTTESAKPVTLIASGAPKPSSSSAPSTVSPRKENYKIDKLMMLSNPSFSFVLDQIEHQSRLSRRKE